MHLGRDKLFYAILFAILEIVFHFSYKFAVMYSYIKPSTVYFLNVRFFELVFLFFSGFFAMRFLCERRIVKPRFFHNTKSIAISLFIVFMFEIMFFEVIAANLHNGISPIYAKILVYSLWLPFTFILGGSFGYFFKPRLKVIR